MESWLDPQKNQKLGKYKTLQHNDIYETRHQTSRFKAKNIFQFIEKTPREAE